MTSDRGASNMILGILCSTLGHSVSLEPSIRGDMPRCYTKPDISCSTRVLRFDSTDNIYSQPNLPDGKFINQLFHLIQLSHKRRQKYAACFRTSDNKDRHFSCGLSSHHKRLSDICGLGRAADEAAITGILYFFVGLMHVADYIIAVDDDHKAL